MKKKLLFIGAICLTVLANAQVKDNIDSQRSETVHLTEQQLLQEQQQYKVDELVKSRLQKEIDVLTADSKRKKQLEQQLHEIGVHDSIRKTEQKAKIELLKRTAKGYPVILNNDTLFFIYTRSGSFNANDRAAAISARLEKLYDDEFFNPDKLLLAESDDGYDVIYNKDIVIMSVSFTDALYFDKTPQQLGNGYLQVIKQTIDKNKKANSVFSWLKRIFYAALVIIGIFIVIYLINRLFKLLSTKIIANKDTYVRSLTIRNYNLFSSTQNLKLILRLLTVLRLITILIALYLSLPVLFSIFPQTESYTYTLLNWIISPTKSVLQSVFGYLPNFFTVIVIYFFTRYAVKGVKYFAKEVETGKLKIGGFYSDWA